MVRRCGEVDEDDRVKQMIHLYNRMMAIWGRSKEQIRRADPESGSRGPEVRPGAVWALSETIYELLFVSIGNEWPFITYGLLAASSKSVV